MTQGLTDRRVVRTRQALHQALVTLIGKRAYDAITVEDICTQAGVGRSTFYAHYTGKDDLKRSGVMTLRRELLACLHRPNGVRRRFAFSLELLRHARAHLEHYRAMFGSRAGAVSLDVVRKILNEFVRNEVAAQMPAGPRRATAVAFVVGGYMAALTQWLDHGAKESPEELDEILRGLIDRGLA